MLIAGSRAQRWPDGGRLSGQQAPRWHDVGAALRAAGPTMARRGAQDAHSGTTWGVLAAEPWKFQVGGHEASDHRSDEGNCRRPRVPGLSRPAISAGAFRTRVHPEASRPGAQGRQARAPEAARQHRPAGQANGHISAATWPQNRTRTGRQPGRHVRVTGFFWWPLSDGTTTGATLRAPGPTVARRGAQAAHSGMTWGRLSGHQAPTMARRGAQAAHSGTTWGAGQLLRDDVGPGRPRTAPLRLSGKAGPAAAAGDQLPSATRVTQEERHPWAIDGRDRALWVSCRAALRQGQAVPRTPRSNGLSTPASAVTTVPNVTPSGAA